MPWLRPVGQGSDQAWIAAPERTGKLSCMATLAAALTEVHNVRDSSDARQTRSERHTVATPQQDRLAELQATKALVEAWQGSPCRPLVAQHDHRAELAARDERRLSQRRCRQVASKACLERRVGSIGCQRQDLDLKVSLTLVRDVVDQGEDWFVLARRVGRDTDGLGCRR